MHKTKGLDIPVEGDYILVSEQLYPIHSSLMYYDIGLDGISDRSYDLQFIEKYKDMRKYIVVNTHLDKVLGKYKDSISWTFYNIPPAESYKEVPKKKKREVPWPNIIPKTDIVIPMPECKPPKEDPEDTIIDLTRYLLKTFTVMIGSMRWDIQAHTVEQVANIAVFKILKTVRTREIVAMVPLTEGVFIVEKDRIIL